MLPTSPEFEYEQGVTFPPLRTGAGDKITHLLFRRHKYRRRISVFVPHSGTDFKAANSYDLPLIDMASYLKRVGVTEGEVDSLIDYIWNFRFVMAVIQSGGHVEYTRLPEEELQLLINELETA